MPETPEDQNRHAIGGVFPKISELVEITTSEESEALDYASGMGFEGVADRLQSMLEAELAVASESQDPISEQLAAACQDILSPEDCEDLSAMPVEDVIGYAFSLLLEAGEDPEEFLKQKGILE